MKVNLNKQKSYLHEEERTVLKFSSGQVRFMELLSVYNNDQIRERGGSHG